MKTTGFIKRIFGRKKVQVVPAPATELTARLIEVHVVEIREILVGMAASLEKMVKGTNSLSRYFELQIKRQEEMDEITNIPPSKADFLY